MTEDAVELLLMSPDGDEPKARFAAALREQLRALAMTQRELADRVGAGESTVSNWCAGRDEPRPRAVFAIEETLGLQAGTLSRHLGYLPVAEWEAVSLEAAILADPVLDDVQRSALLGIYKTWRRDG